MLSLADARKDFEPDRVYVNTASIGLPPRRGLKALDDAIAKWRTAHPEGARHDELITRSRAQFSALVNTTPERVAIGNQVSTFSALVANALPDGARVLAAEEDFTSVIYPFLAHADRGVRVQALPLAELVDAIRPGI